MNMRGRKTAMAIFTSVLLLAGCGKETAQNSAPPSGEMESSPEQTVSSDVKEGEVPDREEETQGRFQYDEKLFDLRLPVVEEEQAMADGKTLLTLQPNLPNTWLKEVTAGFNRQSEDYFIRLEDVLEEGDKERMLVEILAGRGPDIISGEVFEVTESILKKGVLVDLAPGLEARGVTEEEYFPSVWALRMGEKVYGVRPYAEPHGFCIKESVLGSKEPPDIETLVEKLYTYPDQDAVWASSAQSRYILEYLLSGSEDLWGMIDWEEGTCDFSGELFKKILEIAKRYADPERKTKDAEDRWVTESYNPMWKPRRQHESEGKVVVNYLFDDGNYPAYYRLGDTMMLNAGSEHQEGAWEFLEYLLGGEGQCYAAGGSGSLIVASREMSRSAIEYDLKLLEEGRMQTTSDYSPETIEELFEFVEQGHQIPLRTKEVLAIIYEEAQTFCEGGKPLEEVCGVIQNRVQIYVSEMM